MSGRTGGDCGYVRLEGWRPWHLGKFWNNLNSSGSWTQLTVALSVLVIISFEKVFEEDLSSPETLSRRSAPSAYDPSSGIDKSPEWCCMGAA